MELVQSRGTSSAAQPAMSQVSSAQRQLYALVPVSAEQLLQDAHSAFNEASDLFTHTCTRLQTQIHSNTAHYRDLFERSDFLVRNGAPERTTMAYDMLGKLENDGECLPEFRRLP